jgi:hypothetical protein
MYCQFRSIFPDTPGLDLSGNLSEQLNEKSVFATYSPESIIPGPHGILARDVKVV